MEFRRVLAQVAGESAEADWSSDFAGMIGKARLELARSAKTRDVIWGAYWKASNREACEALLSLLCRQVGASEAAELVSGIIKLDPTPRARRQARETLLGLLANQTNPSEVKALIGGIVQLSPEPEDRRQARQMLVSLLATQTTARRVADQPETRNPGCWQRTGRVSPRPI